MKAFRLFTGHGTSPKVLPPDLRAELPADAKATFYFKDVPKDLRDALWQRFKDALEPLRQAGKLGMVHFQFAPWLLRNRDGHAHVAHCVETMRDYTVSVEFRNQTWFDDAHLGQTLAFERELNVVHTVVDGPQGFHNSVPPVWESTHIDFALVRLHGRNPRPGTSRARRSRRSASTMTIRTPSSTRSRHVSSGSRRRPSPPTS